jgi:hypothetical protein
MELVVFAGALVVLDVLAYFFGYNSREVSALDHHDRALAEGQLAGLLDSRLLWSSGSR